MMNDQKIVTVIRTSAAIAPQMRQLLRPVLDRPLLAHMVARVQAARRTGTVVLATTTEPADDAFAAMASEEGLLCFRSRQDDLLGLTFIADQLPLTEVLVTLSGDSPLIDPRVIDRVLDIFLELGCYDYLSNRRPPSYPAGNEVEVMTMAALRQAWNETEGENGQRPTTPFIWQNPDRFYVGNVSWECGLNYSLTHRWKLEAVEDFRFAKATYEALFPEDPLFGLDDILSLLQRRPDLQAFHRREAAARDYEQYQQELQRMTPAGYSAV